MAEKILIREKTPYEVTITNNPLEALDIARKGEIDLVIADLKMPGLNGMELLDAIKRVVENIPVILITAYGTVESAAETMQKGGFDFITKPFRKEQILFTIDRAMKWIQLQRENKMLKDQLKSKT
jgi:DNA-binding NtrC family response regulator